MDRYVIGTTADGIELIRFAVVNTIKDISIGSIRYEDDDKKSEVVQDLKNLKLHLDELLDE